jgi:hypothetical protein
LHLAVAERPILPRRIDQTNKNVLLSHIRSRVKIVGYPAVEGLLHICGPPCQPEDLNKNDARRVIDSEIACVGVDQLLGSVPCDDLKLVMLRDFSNLNHRVVYDVADRLGQFGCRVIADIYSYQRHFGPFDDWFGRRRARSGANSGAHGFPI